MYRIKGSVFIDLIFLRDIFLLMLLFTSLSASVYSFSALALDDLVLLTFSALFFSFLTSILNGIHGDPFFLISFPDLEFLDRYLASSSLCASSGSQCPFHRLPSILARAEIC